MKLAVLAVGHRQPGWVNDGCAEYLKRMPRELPASVSEIKPEPRGSKTREQLLEQLLEEDRANVETLMLYPEETRLHILEATKHPEALIRMQNLQTRSQTAFRALVETYPERVQQQVWDLTRYPSP